MASTTQTTRYLSGSQILLDTSSGPRLDERYQSDDHPKRIRPPMPLAFYNTRFGRRYSNTRQSHTEDIMSSLPPARRRSPPVTREAFFQRSPIFPSKLVPATTGGGPRRGSIASLRNHRIQPSKTLRRCKAVLWTPPRLSQIASYVNKPLPSTPQTANVVLPVIEYVSTNENDVEICADDTLDPRFVVKMTKPEESTIPSPAILEDFNLAGDDDTSYVSESFGWLYRAANAGKRTLEWVMRYCWMR